MLTVYTHFDITSKLHIILLIFMFNPLVSDLFLIMPKTDDKHDYMGLYQCELIRINFWNIWL